MKLIIPGGGGDRAKWPRALVKAPGPMRPCPLVGLFFWCDLTLKIIAAVGVASEHAPPPRILIGPRDQQVLVSEKVLLECTTTTHAGGSQPLIQWSRKGESMSPYTCSLLTLLFIYLHILNSCWPVMVVSSSSAPYFISVSAPGYHLGSCLLLVWCNCSAKSMPLW